MSIVHHPSATVLADYVSGAMRPAFAVVVAAHLEGCACCRDEAATLEAAGGALLDDLAPAPLATDRLERVMAALEAISPEAWEAPKPTLDRIAFNREQWLAPGMSIRRAQVSGDKNLLYLLRLPAGTRTLPHGHQGVEFTAVLKGAYVDGQGRFGAGDFCELGKEVDHQPQVAPESECICLIASELPMRQVTALGRLVHLLTKV